MVGPGQGRQVPNAARRSVGQRHFGAHSCMRVRWHRERGPPRRWFATSAARRARPAGWSPCASVRSTARPAGRVGWPRPPPGGPAGGPARAAPAARPPAPPAPRRPRAPRPAPRRTAAARGRSPPQPAAPPRCARRGAPVVCQHKGPRREAVSKPRHAARSRQTARERLPACLADGRQQQHGVASRGGDACRPPRKQRGAARCKILHPGERTATGMQCQRRGAPRSAVGVWYDAGRAGACALRMPCVLEVSMRDAPGAAGPRARWPGRSAARPAC